MPTTKLPELRRQLLNPGFIEFNKGIELFDRIRRHLTPDEEAGFRALINVVKATRLSKHYTSGHPPTPEERTLAMRTACEAYATLPFEEIDLSHWGVAALPDAVGTFTCKTLNVSMNPLTALPDAMGEMVNLRVLWANGTQLESLPTGFGTLKLTELTLAQGRVQHFPEVLLSMPTLTSLDLSGNPLATLPEALTGCTQLRWLSLHHTQLSELPRGIERLTQLKKLLLHGSRFSASTVASLRAALPGCEIVIT